MGMEKSVDYLLTQGWKFSILLCYKERYGYEL